MRRSSMPRPMSGFAAGMLTFVLSCCFSSCVDDTFDKYGQGASGPLSFAVNVPDGWTNGSTRAADTDISIKKMSQSGGLQQLYLVTEVSEAAASTAASDAVTRGAPVTSGDKFIEQSFGLSAICYAGGWPDNSEEEKQLTTNFAHNLRVKKSPTGTEWIPQSKLDWLGSGNVKFFAYSPYSEDFKPDNEPGSGDETENSVAGGNLSHSAPTASGIPTLTYTVSTVAENQPDLMVAVSDVHDQGKGNNGAVQLQFRHALTAVTVKTGKEMLKGIIKEVTFSDVYGKGTYQFATNADNLGSWTTGGERPGDFTIAREIMVSNTEDTGGTEDTQEKENNYVDPNNPVSIVDGEFTLMMIPQTLPKEAKLTIVFVNEMTRTEHTLTANLSPEGKTKWEIGKKVTYSVSTNGIAITPVVELRINGKKVAPFSVDGEEIDEESEWKDSLCISGYLPNVDFIAYAKVAQEGKTEDKVALPYVIECSTDNGKTWNSTVSMAHVPDAAVNIWNPVAETARASDEDVDKRVSGVMFLPQQPAYAGMQKEFFPLNFTPASGVATSTKDAPYDLTQGGETANCYIVNQPGYYSFPAIYGNARKSGDPGDGKGGEPNRNAYTSNVEAEYVLKKFVKHDDLPIDDIHVKGARRAALVWQDAPGLVTDVSYDETTNMVKFHVAKETLTQGNAVIAVLDGEGDDATILWSWHIWATHYPWYAGYNKEDYKVQSGHEDKQEFYLAPCNLGYCDSHKGDSSRTIQVRFRFILEDVVDIEHKERIVIFYFPQPGIVESLAGDNTYFQWGRKDPMLPGVYNAETINNEKLLPSPDENQRPVIGQMTMANKKYYPGIREFGRGVSRVPIGEAIKNPHLHYMNIKKGDYNDDRSHWHNGENADYKLAQIINLWDSQLSGGGQQYWHFEGAKSVYDPSPAGYHIPPVNAFTGFGAPSGEVLNGKDAGGQNHNEYKISAYDEGGKNFVIQCVLEGKYIKGWELRSAATGKFIFFPGCGLRDMGEKNDVSYFKNRTWAAHAQLTFIATSSMSSVNATAQNTIIYLDQRDHGMREEPQSDSFVVRAGTNKAYGFSVRPVLDK